MLILNVTPRVLPDLVTFALEDIQVGDRVEMFEPPPAPLRAAEPMNPPLDQLHRRADDSACGETATIICDANSPDNRPLSLSFSSTAASFCRATTLPGWTTAPTATWNRNRHQAPYR